jgi:hypothetical protein
VEEFTIRARGAEAEANKRGARPDHPDLWLPKLRVAVEVKGRNLYFKYCEDFPKDTVYVCSERGLKKMQESGIPRIALVIISIPTKHMLAIPWQPELWWVEQTKQRDGFCFNVMVAGRDQLRSMSWLLHTLRSLPRMFLTGPRAPKIPEPGPLFDHPGGKEP